MKVMISEDDFRVAELHAQFLRMMEGVDMVGKALNAEETMRLLEETQPDLLLLDVYMPDQLGVNLLHQVREKVPHVDVIMITAAKEKEVVEKAMKYGVLDYIIKPITLDRFQETIQRYMERKEKMANIETFDQAAIDQLIKPSVKSGSTPVAVPKGIDPLTLEKVEAMLDEAKDDGLTADQASTQMGASKTTARRYLEYLISIQKGKAEMNYGKVGRPQRKYYKKS
ncbi:two-component system, CitB family, response regulator CitT [Halobacillus karajensis]|uniref:Transcriptional regulatory protein CitT n=1 Tax=Halobacillus karajensis TaxID=195088 RepID=A0A024P3G4_9BACI|nr:response regulator [Halobacillus karajensis]CDQ19129.1 Transcriptional regulatory protein CitT [Halobacillus karajensis]CDQ22797.1 Transcriptional regulatory protein CitT [Halobacillus karajensis]CDQ26279.1 Transcriptional regulatory protein CitT [Halobacillus karajensis]SEH41159.1 two-component system, CitB family, response regulator CitT [Halobacillus karajensis]